MLHKKIDGSVEVKGSDDPEYKAKASLNFANGDIRCLVSKASIFGFGSNFQSCHNEIFCGLSDSYERFYQAVRRCWRFGQSQTVNVYIIISEKEISILENIRKKQVQMDEMQKQMTALMKDVTLSEIKRTTRITTNYNPEKDLIIPGFLKGA
jgi:SNF2 family DNA or RNA helicase